MEVAQLEMKRLQKIELEKKEKELQEQRERELKEKKKEKEFQENERQKQIAIENEKLRLENEEKERKLAEQMRIEREMAEKIRLEKELVEQLRLEKLKREEDERKQREKLAQKSTLEMLEAHQAKDLPLLKEYNNHKKNSESNVTPTELTQSTKKMKITDSPQKIKVPQSFVEMGLNVEIVAIAIELFGLDDDFKILDYVDSVSKLQEKLSRNFPVIFIKYAKQIFEKDDKKVLPFLMEIEKARKYSKDEKEIFDTLNIFDNDAKKKNQRFFGGKQILIGNGI